MATSQARIDANRRNALLATGPTSPEGKAISRRNALKHGLTGAGIVLPDEDVEAIDERLRDLQAEFAPKTKAGAILVQRIAFLSVRLERCARHEAKAVGTRMRWAAEKYTNERIYEVERTMAWIAAEPAVHARRLRGTPEGVDRLIVAWLELDASLADPTRGRWDYGEWQRLENLEGKTPEDRPLSRDGALCKAFWGEPQFLEPGEAEGLDAPARREWARAQLRERIAARLAELRALRAGFDPVALAKDRDEAMQRAIFDDSKPATLARKYEAAAERGLYKALKELREVEAAADRQDEEDATPLGETDCEALVSSLTAEDAEPTYRPPTRRLPRNPGPEYLKTAPKSARKRYRRLP